VVIDNKINQNYRLDANTTGGIWRRFDSSQVKVFVYGDSIYQIEYDKIKQA
jgi:hypothetical protein